MSKRIRPGTQRVRWSFDTLTPKLTLFHRAFRVGLRSQLNDLAEEVEEYAKENAPWEDQTGDARNGLTAEARHRQDFYYIDLFHTVDYGIWLEVRWNGRYAIILPTLEAMGPKVMSGLDMETILEYGYSGGSSAASLSDSG